MTIKTKEITVGLGQLMLDPNNYRLNDGADHIDLTTKEIVHRQVETQQRLIKENISDLETSILRNGFLEVDKIVVKELDDDLGEKKEKRFLVIEGNRRVAAFKSLISEYYDHREEKFFDDFPEQLKEKYKRINVILVEGSEEEIKDYSYRLMGIRHVSGPRQWGGYQSAKLITDMVRSGQDYKKISTLLGMRPAEVQRRHQGFQAFMQMKNDPEYAERADSKLFSLFAEMVGGNKYFKNEWLGWNSEKGLFENKENLYRIYDAITPRADNELEVKNPSDLRKFSKNVLIKEVRVQLESGTLLRDIDYDYDAEKRINKIKSFITHVKKTSDISRAELELFEELKARLEELLEKEGGQQ
ncbi:hypothetical protein Q667_06025 [Marinobacter sp. C1S70]|uniref:ParB N-terminal domain-containing protein n=1 Tax=Marinobacter sp. C1S70 TaxID=1396859 RepID=UPI0003B904E7|nr:ParB N-terminal domain-containing protein [Marinobacter sp. C1S70]ERS82090.1 hypothetical protein Q667_06025 [Marinobacter sp. C1S70]|tara:strand:- start:686 stop:1756 length:1071 start_codon:yes stop_codon:yes gene_type:complete